MGADRVFTSSASTFLVSLSILIKKTLSALACNRTGKRFKIGGNRSTKSMLLAFVQRPYSVFFRKEDNRLPGNCILLERSSVFEKNSIYGATETKLGAV